MAVFLRGMPVVDFLRRYRVQLNFRLRAGETAPIDDCVRGPVYRTLEFPVGTRFRFEDIPVTGDDATIKLLRQEGTYETKVRYLPWQPDRCVYTRLDDAAEIVFTGPLTGCNIYVCGPRTDPVFFHTNSNTSADDVTANNNDKRTMTLNLLAANVLGLNPGTNLGGKLERATYSGAYLGFVVGVKTGTDWAFYFNGIGAGTSTLRRIF